LTTRQKILADDFMNEREIIQRLTNRLSGGRFASLRTRRAVYHAELDRIYRTTRSENELGVMNCPRCKKEMDLQPYTRKNKIYICPKCGWKITTDKLLVVTAECKTRRGSVDSID